MITDAQRLEFLRNGGYLPNHFDQTTAALDWALEHGYCPAYWRAAKNDFEIERTMPPSGNGMVFVKHGDRNRIDEIILARKIDVL